jgi:reactive intermediate/imine deaminase
LKRHAIATDQAPAPDGSFSQGIRRNDLIFLAGQGPFTPAGDLIDDSFEAAARQAFRNLAAVAEAGGGKLSEAVRVGVYLSDMTNFEAMDAIYREFFSEPFPARSTIQTALPGFPIEIDAIVGVRL